MNTADKNICEQVLKIAKDNGASSSDVILTKGKSLSLKAQQQKIDELKVSSAQTVGIRVLQGNKVGISYSESFDSEALKYMVNSALDNAKNMKEDLHQKIDSSPGEHIIESKFNKTDLDKKIELVLKLESEVYKRDSRVKGVPYNGLTETESEYHYLNTSGTYHYENDFYYSGFTSALVEDKGVNSMHYHGGIGREIDKLNIANLVDESLEHAINWLDAKPVPTGNYDLIFTPDSFESLKGVFGIIFSAKSAVEKMNPFKDKLNSIIADERLSIKDCPKFKDSFFKSYLDSEGFGQEDLVLIENGKLINFYQNSKTAHELNMKNNFRGARSARSGLSVSGTTQVWQGTDGSDQKVIAGKYLEIHSLQGLHSGANPISGEFSFGASGYLCEDGKRIKPVKGVTVSGNFYELLNKIETFGQTLQTTSDSGFFAPLIRFNKVSVAGE